MLRLAVFLSISVVVVLGGKSPNADKVETFVNSLQGSRYSNDVLEDAELDVPDLISKYGYPVEIHQVVTSDGYILEMHRIPHGRDSNNNPGPRPVVFLMHGLLSSSADYVILGPGNALAYILADAGYDVWLGNARGNFYSRRHITMNPDARNLNFWKFSWDEIGNFDLPAMIDFALYTSGQQKLHYIGHSQGGTTFFVLNSLRPEFNDRFISFQGLAPASFFINNENAMFNSLARFERILETTLHGLGFGEIFGDSEFMEWFNQRFCDGLSVFGSLCSFMTINGENLGGYVNSTMLPVIIGHAPAGASVRQVAHFGQSINDNDFRRFNFGMLTNLREYGKVVPPSYELSKVVVPSYIYYGLNDAQVDYRDVYILVDKLGNVKENIQVGRPTFTHFDFIWAKDARTVLYPQILSNMKKEE